MIRVKIWTPMDVPGLALLAISLCSGAAALIYQVTWLRWFRLLFGNTAYAASATLCAFFLGLAVGAALFGRLSARARRPLRWYAGIEAGAAGFALLVPLIISAYGPIYSTLYERLIDDRALFILVKFGLALLAMLPPAVLLGGTLPPLAAAFVRDPERLGRQGSILYATNTLGAAVGTALGALWLPEIIGVSSTYGLGLALSMAISVAALGLSRRFEVAAAPQDRGRTRSAPALYLTIAFASGLGTLALEVLLIHALSQVLDSSVYSYGAVLLVVLAALAAGAAIVAGSEARISGRALLEVALAVEAVLLLTLPAAFHFATGGLERIVSGTLVNGLLLAAVFGGPALLAGALVLPLSFRLAAGGPVGERVGGLLAANTLGGVLGSLAASFVLLDWLGLWEAIAAVGLFYGCGALLAASSRGRRAGLAAVFACTAVALLATPANPLSLPSVFLGIGEELIAVREGAHGVVSVVEQGGERRIKIDNHYNLGGSLARVGQERSGHLSLLLHPDPKRVLFVGSATGGSAAAAVVHPVDEIVLVEIVPEVQELASEFFNPVTRGVHRDPRTRLVIEDGRNHLRAAPELYDVVMADLFVPWRPGVGSMYSLEHFRSVRDHLTPNGVFCQWLALFHLSEEDFRQIAATFVEVFPEATLWRGHFSARKPIAALVGTKGSPASVESIDRRIGLLADRGLRDPTVTDPRAFWMLYVGPIAPYLDSGPALPLNSDDHPHFEYRAGRSTSQGHRAFMREVWPSIVEDVVARRERHDPVFASVPGPGPRAGAALARANALRAAGKWREALAMEEEVRRMVPRELLARVQRE